MNTTKCLTPDCQNASVRRGVCLACYESHRRSIRRGSVTWKKLETLGLVNEPAKNRCSSRAAIALKAATKRAPRKPKLARAG